MMTTKKYLDWKRLIGFSLIFTPCYAFVMFASHGVFWSIFTSIIISATFVISMAFANNIIQYFYHNGKEEQK